MKTIKIGLILLIPAMFGLMITSCKKESSSSSSNSLTNQQVAQVQNSDVQDALAEKTDQDVDKAFNELQAANYQVPAAKAYSTSGSLVISVDHPDSTTFPKVISFVYTNFQDSTADESFVKNGEVDITVTLTTGTTPILSWTEMFKHFSVTTDSTTFTVDGSRMVERTSHSFQFNGLEGARYTATDAITGDLSYSITKTGTSDSLKFTRVLSRTRDSFIHFKNLGGATWAARWLRNDLAKDTIKWSGTVTGVNEDGNQYSKSVNASSPLLVRFYAGTPIIASGILDYSFTGTASGSFTITFKEDPNYPRWTQITVTDNSTGHKFTFDRRFSRKFRRWW